MPTPYNHKAIEKTREESMRSITASTCSHIRLETVCT